MKNTFHIGSKNGQILYTCESPLWQTHPRQPGMDMLSVDEKTYRTVLAGMSTSGYRVVSGSVVALPPKPNDYSKFDYVTGQWVDDVELATSMVLLRRTRELVASDWTQLPDVPFEIREAWIIYRQSLRDITDQVDYPLNVIWPVKP